MKEQTFQEQIKNLTWFNLVEKLKKALRGSFLSNIQAGDNIILEGDGSTDNPLVISSTSSVGGNFVPLSGTEEGSPITGKIDFNYPDEGITESIYFDTFLNIFVFGNENYNVSNNGFKGFSAGGINQFTGSGLSYDVTSEDVLFKGFTGSQYYGANYDDNTYVQKKYVDDVIAALRQEILNP